MSLFSELEIEKFLKLVDFNKSKDKLIPVITQDFESNQVLMLAYANRSALKKTLETGYAHYYSRSRNEIWKKGETSGHIQKIANIYLDCDNDAVLLQVHQEVAACHTGYFSCFHKRFNGELVLNGTKKFNPETLYKK